MQLKINKQKAALKKLTISKIKIEQIKNFWKENFGKLIRIQDVWNGVWEQIMIVESLEIRQ